jgi:tripartite-type tricarboxylate transporter receptor subunit TctC
MNMRRLLSIWVVSFFVFVGLGIADTAFAIDKPKGYPKRAIEVVVPHGPGAGADHYARAFLKGAEKELGVPLKFSFMSGSAGAVGTAYAAAQPADGYTLLLVSTDIVINMALGRGKVDVDKFEWLARGIHDVSAIHTRVDNKDFQSIKEIQEYCKKNPKTKLTIAGAGALGIDHIWVELLNKRGNLCLKFIPFDNSGERRASFQGGHTTLQSDETIDMEGLYQAKVSKPIVVGYEKRLAKYPDVPTTVELGIDNTIGRWRGFAVKKGTPKPVVDYLTAVLKKAYEDPEYQAYLKKEVGHDREAFASGNDFKNFVISERKIFGDIAKELGWLDK